MLTVLRSWGYTDQVERNLLQQSIAMSVYVCLSVRSLIPKTVFRCRRHSDQVEHGGSGRYFDYH